jgi:dTDP-4-dehydrorhamnose reductase
MKKLLVLGITGKVGTSILKEFQNKFHVNGISRKDFDVLDFEKLKNYINKNNFDIVVNCVAHLGIDPCEIDPVNAHKSNTLLPRFLADESNKHEFTLVHFSTDAVFADNFNNSYDESNFPSPVNIYGYSKYCGDLFVQNIAERYYIIRIPLIFGFSQKKSQFFEKMVEKIIDNQDIKISDDIITTPTYSDDVAKEVLKIISNNKEYGIYHVNNSGEVSLYGLISEYIKIKNISTKISKSSYKDFQHIGRKNTKTILKSNKIPIMRNWKLALSEYINNEL